MAKDLKIFIGSDPEFVFYSDDAATVHAAGPIVRSQKRISQQWFGYDGTQGSSCAELRPPPALTVSDFISGIKQAMAFGLKTFPRTSEYRWHAGTFCGGVWPIGGHLHVSCDRKDNSYVHQLTSLLDMTVGIPFARIELPGERLARLRANPGPEPYGGMGIYRNQKWGIEYRTPPSWLVSPMFASAAFAGAHLAAVSSRNLDIPRIDVDVSRQRRANANNNLLESWEVVARYVRTLPDYDDYAKYLEPLYRMADRSERWQPLSEDMKDTWGLMSSPSVENHDADILEWSGISSEIKRMDNHLSGIQIKDRLESSYDPELLDWSEDYI